MPSVVLSSVSATSFHIQLLPVDHLVRFQLTGGITFDSALASELELLQLAYLLDGNLSSFCFIL